MARPTIDNVEALSRTVQIKDDRPPRFLMLQVANAADEAPPWWSLQRDIYLDKFWPSEPYLAGAVYSIASRNSSFRWELTGPERDVWWAHQLLTNADFGQGWQSFITKVTLDTLCLAGRTRVHLGGERIGKVKTIAQIVKDKDPGPVLSVDSAGHIVERKIIEWHKTPLGNRRWWWISLNKASCHVRENRGGIFMTEDHPVLTSTGWLYARDVKPGMLVATGDPSPSDEQCEFLTGALLGDGSIKLIRNRSSLSFCHCIKQEDWLDFKINVLSGFQWTGRWTHESHFQGYDSVSVGINSRGSLALTEWRNAWYPDGKKVIPHEYVEKYFSPRMLAVWYCDDGTLQRSYTRAGNFSTYQGTLYTNGFSEDEVVWLANFLTEKGIKCTFHWHPYNSEKKYPVIYITAEGMRQLAQVIGPYVPPSMRYKLPDGAPEYDPSLWELEPAKTHYDEVVESRERDYKSGKGVCQTTYHIGVEETGCFVAANTVVHNTQGNGGFFEVIRPAKARMTKSDDIHDAICMPNSYGDPTWIPFDSKSGEVYRDAIIDIDFKITDFPLDLPIGLAHLDSQRCTRTGNPQYPVIYTDSHGVQHKLNWYQVVTIEEMPSPREDMLGVQHSAVDRALRLSQILRDMLVYKQEKISGRFARAVHITNADAQLLQDAIDQANTNADDRALTRYMQPIILSTVDPEARPEVATIPLANLPDGFNEEDTMRWYVAGLANAFGVDYGFLAPLPGNKLGTSTQAETQERQARGKSSRFFMQLITHKFNYSGILPRTVEFKFAVADPWEESEQDSALARRARSYQTFIQSGLLPIEIVRQIAADHGDIDPKYLEAIGEVDMTPIVTVSGTDVRTFTRRGTPRITLEKPEPEEQPEEDATPRVPGSGEEEGE